TDEAIRLFSQTDSVDDVLMKSYNEYLGMFLTALRQVKEMAASPVEVDALVREEDQKQFVDAFKQLTRMLVRLQTFTEFEFDPEILEIDSQTYEDYKSKYLKIADNVKRAVEKISILQDVDFELELMHTDRINVSYIMNLIRDIDLDNEEELKEKIRFIEEEIERADSPELRLKVDLIKGFLQKVVPGLTNEDSIDDAYNKYEEQAREEEINQFATGMGLPS
ncbi:hypothetical protein J4G37_41465, partial [Microvirga sp. 3-52]|nr:hypothetical protein [Microvirga sp. 3-52]